MRAPNPPSKDLTCRHGSTGFLNAYRSPLPLFAVRLSHNTQAPTHLTQAPVERGCQHEQELQKLAKGDAVWCLRARK